MIETSTIVCKGLYSVLDVSMFRVLVACANDGG
jgi:hypothetical protein